MIRRCVEIICDRCEVSLILTASTAAAARRYAQKECGWQLVGQGDRKLDVCAGCIRTLSQPLLAAPKMTIEQREPMLNHWLGICTSCQHEYYLATIAGELNMQASCPACGHEEIFAGARNSWSFIAKRDGVFTLVCYNSTKRPLKALHDPSMESPNWPQLELPIVELEIED